MDNGLTIKKKQCCPIEMMLKSISHGDANDE